MDGSIMRAADNVERGGLQKSVGYAVSAGLLATLLLVVGVSQFLAQQRDASRWVRHTLEVMLQIESLERDLQTAAAEGRGFLIDHSSESLRRFDIARGGVQRDMVGLRDLTSDNAAQTETVGQLGPLVAQRLDVMQAIIGHAKDGDQATAVAMAQTQRGRNLGTQIVGVTAQLRGEEQRLLAERTLRAHVALERALATAIICGVVAAGSLFFVLSITAIRRRRRLDLRALQESETRHQAAMARVATDLAEVSATRHAALIATQRAVDMAGGDLDGVMSAVAQGALSVVPRADGAVVEMLDGNELVYRAASGSSAAYIGLRISAATSFSGMCIRQGRPLICEDSEVDTRVDREACRWVGVVSMLVVPVPHHGRNVGVLKLHAGHAGALTEDDVPIAQLLVGALAAGLSGVSEAAATDALHRLNASLERQVRERTAELAASEAKLRDHFANLADGVVVFRVCSDGAIVYSEVNPAAERMLGLRAATVRGRRPDQVWPREHAAMLGRQLRDCLAAGGAITSSEFLDIGDTSCELSVVLTPVQGADGVVHEIIKTLRDVTEEARLQRKLRESETLHRLLTEHASDMVCRIARDGALQYVSPAAARIYGVTSEHLLARGLLDQVDPDDQPMAAMLTRQLLAGEIEEVRIDYRVRNPERGEVWAESVSRRVIDPTTGAADGYIAIIRDVTERRRVEAERDAQRRALETSHAELERLARHLARARDQAERASRAKSQFLAGVSHELRTPLNGVLGYAQLLQSEGGLSARQEGRVTAMLAAGRHLLDMINRVLDLSEVESEHSALRVEEVDVAAVASACLDLVRPAAEAKGLSLGVEAVPGALPLIETDLMRLRQVLLNLLGNAVKFTTQGSVTLRLVSGEIVGRHAGVCLDVIDTGPGIPAALRGRLFQDFERLGADAMLVEGAGLGLALSGRLAALLGGDLVYQDNPRGGSIFRLSLPLRVPSPLLPATAAATTGAVAARSVAAGAAAEPALVPARALRVLVADDVAMNRDIAESFLRAAGHEVVCAVGGAEAVTAALTEDFDVVLMDVRMPGIDGMEATRRIRANAGPRGRVPIVALTAQAFAEQVAACRAAGMDSHLAKPFTPEALQAALAAAVATHVATATHEAGGDEAGARPPPETTEAGSEAVREAMLFDPGPLETLLGALSVPLVVDHLDTLIQRGRALQAALRATPRHLGGGAGATLASAAHTLAGSGGMFGFARLAVAAREFERAVQNGDPAESAMAARLDVVIDESLVAMAACRADIFAQTEGERAGDEKTGDEKTGGAQTGGEGAGAAALEAA